MPIDEAATVDDAALGFVLNGVNAVTGRLLVESVSLDELARAARGLPPTEEVVAEKRRRDEAVDFLGVGIELHLIEQAGWGIVFAHDANPALREALQPLLELRAAKAGDLYKEFSGARGYTAPETCLQFRARHEQPPGKPNPRKVPHYLLLVGGPDAIPFEFQYQLDLNHFVGRIAFDTVEEYAAYAAAVAAAESGKLRRPRTLALFGTRNRGDRATQLSSTKLIAPLATAFASSEYGAVTSVNGATATKARLADLLRGESAPAVLMTASHGIAFPASHERQRRSQGALLCQDWDPFGGALSPDVYFGADDVPDDANVAGMIAFHFACYGAGTPQRDDFAPYLKTPVELAPGSFVAALPQRLLAHPRGGALAVIGHVDRAWGYSFAWPGVLEDIATFQSFLEMLAAELPVGLAVQEFNQRYVDCSGELHTLLQAANTGAQAPASAELARAWVAANDARNYVLLGDPAARLPQPS